MKRAVISLFTCVVLLCGCAVVNHEMQDGVSFAGLKKFYVDTPVGTASIFGAYADVASLDAKLAGDIKTFLEERGFESVGRREDAQIIFRPLWNVSVIESRMPEEPIRSSFTSIEIGTSASEVYATLEIQAILPDGDIWAWRGFSPIEVSVRNLNPGSFPEQIRWCLEYFPPEEHPAFLQEYKKEKAEADAEAAENPYKETLIRHRQSEEGQKPSI